MTNYVTGYLPTVEPKDWMKIAVGGVLGAVQLKDLKSFVGASGGSNANTIQLSDVTIPNDTVIYTDDASGSTFQLTFNPIGANENVTVKDISTNNALTSATYNASTRTVNAVGKTSGENSTILVSWGTGSKQFTIPVKTKDNGTTQYYITFANSEETTNVVKSAEGTANSDKYHVQPFQIMPTTDGYNGGAIVYSSSDDSIASFDSYGNITTKKAGTIQVNAVASNDATIKGSYTLVITDGSNQETDWFVNPNPSNLSPTDFDTNGLTLTSRQDGSYADARVSEITIISENGSETNESLDNYTYDYSGIVSQITIKPKSAGTISTSSTVNVILTLGSETRTASFTVQVATKDKWSFSPESKSVNLDDLVSSGIQTWSRDASSSGEVITWDKVDNHTLNQFNISANENSSGQQTIKLKDKTTVTSGESLVFYATGGGTQKTFTVKIS